MEFARPNLVPGIASTGNALLVLDGAKEDRLGLHVPKESH